MALKIRLSRGGRKNRPHYSVVVADSRMPRDGRYLEKVGTYNPLLPKDSDQRVTLNAERITYWLSQGAKPSDRVAVFLGKAGLADMPAQRNNPQKAKPKAAALQRIEDKKAKAEARKEADAQAAEDAKAAEEAAANATEAEETPAEEAPAEATATTEEASTDTTDAATETAETEETKTAETAEAPAEEAKADTETAEKEEEKKDEAAA